MLTSVRLGENLLSGSIPSSITAIDTLEELMLFSNHLTGTLPDGLLVLPSLEYLYAYDNQLSGAIPEEDVDAVLIQVALNDNLLSGTILRASWQCLRCSCCSCRIIC